ncbi:MAG: outer membrane protein assembly factor BamE [Thiotrichales bacterium]|nr:outer membrane protein assembly factor BamE [Thiotrichales bacterium]
MSISYKLTLILCVSTGLVLNACGKIEDGSLKPPLVYRIDIQQGNVVDQAMINKLRVGMDKNQVRFIMGTPMLIDPFHDERWEYLFTYQEGGDDRQKRHITLYFDDEKLAYIKGDIKVTHIPTQVEETNTEKSIVVPEDVNKDSFLERWLSDEPELHEKQSTEANEALTGKDADAAQTVSGEDQPIENTAKDTAGETGLQEQDRETLPDAETADEGGFFSNFWDSVTGDDSGTPADAEILAPGNEIGKDEPTEPEPGIATDAAQPIETTESGTAVAQEQVVEVADTETEDAEEEGGFFSGVWNILTGDEEEESNDSEVLQPELENK